MGIDNSKLDLFFFQFLFIILDRKAICFYWGKMVYYGNSLCGSSKSFLSSLLCYLSSQFRPILYPVQLRAMYMVRKRVKEELKW